MLLEKLHAMIYAIQHGSYKEFENAHTELTIACRDADEKLAAAQQSVQLTGLAPCVECSSNLQFVTCSVCGLIQPPFATNANR